MRQELYTTTLRITVLRLSIRSLLYYIIDYCQGNPPLIHFNDFIEKNSFLTTCYNNDYKKKKMMMMMSEFLFVDTETLLIQLSLTFLYKPDTISTKRTTDIHLTSK